MSDEVRVFLIPSLCFSLYKCSKFETTASRSAACKEKLSRVDLFQIQENKSLSVLLC